MRIAVCHNLAAPLPLRGEDCDRIAEQGAAEAAAAVAAALADLGHRPTIVPFGSDPAVFLEQLGAVGAELIVNLCEGLWGDSHLELHATALLELTGLPVTGSGPLSLGLTQDKLRTKELLLANGLPTPRHLVASYGESLAAEPSLRYPLIVKPRSEDASHGITDASVVDDLPALLGQIGYIHRVYRQDALVEEFIHGREINAAILGNDDEAVVLPLAEICFDPALGRPIVSYAGKWLENSPAYRGTVPVCPAQLAETDAAAARTVALAAFRVMGCRDYARVDLRLRDGIPYILEVNANPDISPEAGLARSAMAFGLNYPALIGRIVDTARRRTEKLHAA
jgi:D-alanine-D-alanine ligase